MTARLSYLSCEISVRARLLCASLHLETVSRAPACMHACTNTVLPSDTYASRAPRNSRNIARRCIVLVPLARLEWIQCHVARLELTLPYGSALFLAGRLLLNQRGGTPRKPRYDFLRLLLLIFPRYRKWLLWDNFLEAIVTLAVSCVFSKSDTNWIAGKGQFCPLRITFT